MIRTMYNTSQLLEFRRQRLDTHLGQLLRRPKNQSVVGHLCCDFDLRSPCEGICESLQSCAHLELKVILTPIKFQQPDKKLLRVEVRAPHWKGLPLLEPGAARL